MKIFSCYSCGKEFKNSRSLTLNITRYKSHSSAPSTARSQVNDFKDGDSSISQGSSTATVSNQLLQKSHHCWLNSKPSSENCRKSLARGDEVEDLDKSLFRKYSTEVAGIENKLEKGTKAVRSCISQQTVFLRIWLVILVSSVHY